MANNNKDIVMRERSIVGDKEMDEKKNANYCRKKKKGDEETYLGLVFSSGLT